MPRAAWSAKDERQYEHIKSSCLQSRGKRAAKTCTRIAAATVNKQRAREGRTLSGGAAAMPGWLGAVVILVVALPVTLIATALVNRKAA